MARVHAKITLVRYTENPDELIASAAKLCYATDTSDILEQEPAESEKFVAMLRRLGHLSPIEHASFTFYLEGVSRALTHQLVRHRLASYSQRSQRYVAHEEFDYVVPPQIEGKQVEDGGKAVDAVAYFDETMKIIAERYKKLNEALGRKSESSNEDARYVLPNACETKIFVTMNARELLHFIEERTCSRAQWEIRGVANRMLEILKEKSPAVFDGCGPKCVRLGHCPEGKMTCGKSAEMKERYGRKK
jgi:thymidylate synthase (FAD)